MRAEATAPAVWDAVTQLHAFCNWLSTNPRFAARGTRPRVSDVGGVIALTEETVRVVAKASRPDFEAESGVSS